MEQGIIFVVSPLGKSEGYGPLARQITDAPPIKALLGKKQCPILLERPWKYKIFALFVGNLMITILAHIANQEPRKHVKVIMHLNKHEYAFKSFHGLIKTLI